MDQICTKCGGTGRYAYDENHKRVCEACCKHDKGWWELTEGYYSFEQDKDNRCCLAGCGTMYRDLQKERT